MSFSLFRANIRENRMIWLVISLVFTFYLVVVTSLFSPDSARALEDFMDMLPPVVMDMGGFNLMGTTLISTLAGYLYGMIIFMFPMILSAAVNHRLIARKVDGGSMAYLLATPNTRRKIAVTQAVSSMVSITAFFAVVVAATLAASAAMFPGMLDVPKALQLNAYALSMYLAFGGIGFLASCAAADGRLSLGLGVGIPVGFVFLQMVARAGADLRFFKYLTICTLFDPDAVLTGDGFVWLGMAAFLLLAAALYVIAVRVFERRDLSI